MTVKHMRRFLFIVFALFFCFQQASTVWGTQRGIQRITALTGAGQNLELYKDYHALVLGVSEYDHWPDLPNAVKDAREVKEALGRLGFTVSLELNPSAQQLRDALNNLAFNAGREKDRGVILYFAGHGSTMELADGAQLGYIIPKDCPLKDRDPMGFERKAVSMKDIEILALKIKSKHVLMLFDSCFSGSLFSLVRAAPHAISEKSALPVRQFITAGSEGETVPDRSVFKQVFLNSIQGDADLNNDGYVTGSELGMHLQDKVVNYTRSGQHPQYGKINNPKLDRGDFIFVIGKKHAPAPVALPPVVPTSSGSVPDMDQIIREREDAAQKWSAWQKSMESEYKKAERYDSSKRLKSSEKAAAWTAFLSGFSDDNPTSSQDEELRSKAFSRLQYWEGQSQAALSQEQQAIIPARPTGQSYTNSIGQKFVLIPAGSFMMGSPEKEWDRNSNEDHHTVTISNPFYLMTTEATQGQWRAVMGDNPSELDYCGDECPVNKVSWDDVQEFIRRLNAKEGTNRYRLPTETEWEYACRAGTKTPFAFGWCLTTDQANYMGHFEYLRFYPKPPGYSRGCFISASKAARDDSEMPFSCPRGDYRGVLLPVASLEANAWGVYDMHGNVSEWCQDWMGEYPNGPVVDPSGPLSGEDRVIRGGHWFSRASKCRSASRDEWAPFLDKDRLGFRLAADY